MATNEVIGSAISEAAARGAAISRSHEEQASSARASSSRAPSSQAAGDVLVDIRNISKEYRRGQTSIAVLQNLTLTIPAGTFVALMGPSGSGKSTLLNIIAGLDTPTSGSVNVAGSSLSGMKDDARAAWRAHHVGFIFQTFNLMPVLTALENVALPLLLTTLSLSERQQRAKTALEVVKLGERLGHYPSELSGGQEQRVAIARAIVTDPALIVADEPTGDLDRKSADEVLDLLGALCRDFGKTIVMVTHDPAAAERASVLHRLDKGALV